MIARYYFYSLLRNRFIWFWGGFFSLMWAALGAFIFENGYLTKYSAFPITASWYAIITLISFSSVSVTLSIALAWSTNSLVFSFKFSKLTRGRYLMDLLSAWVLLSIFLIIAGVLFTPLMFSIASRINVFPDLLSIIKTFALAILIGIFFMLLSVFLVLIVISHFNIKTIQFLSFIPMLLVFILSYLFIYGSVPKLLVYISPWDSAPALLQAAYTNHLPVNSFVSTHPLVVSWSLTITGLIIWELIIFALDVYLLRRIKPQDPEVMRQI